MDWLKMKKSSVLGYLLIAFIAGVYGFSVGQWRIFPFSYLEVINNKLEILAIDNGVMKYKMTDGLVTIKVMEHSNEPITQSQFGTEVSIPTNLQFSDRAFLNNFELSWARLEDNEIGKTGAVEFRGNKVWFINQDDSSLLNRIGLADKIIKNGGIKALFSVGDKTFVYVGYIDDGCGSARIYDVNSFEVALQMPCIADHKSVDLNNIGGGWLKVSNDEILLATGTPTSKSALTEINLTAQDKRSWWGKILKLKLQGDKFEVSTYSTGHRNPQGMISLDGFVYSVEHAARGGDEINIIIEGRNYGWPLQSLGSGYNLEEINKDFTIPLGGQSPLFSFVPSIGISSVGDCFELYANYYSPNHCVAVSSMIGNSIFLVVHDGIKVLFYEVIDFGSRIRKFTVEENYLIAVTDFEGLIVGRLDKLE